MTKEEQELINLIRNAKDKAEAFKVAVETILAFLKNDINKK